MSHKRIIDLYINLIFGIFFIPQLVVFMIYIDYKSYSPQSYGYDAYGPTDTQSTRAYDLLKHDYEMAMQKLNSTMNSIKTFWSPELKRERQLRKEETAKLAALQRQVNIIYS